MSKKTQAPTITEETTEQAPSGEAMVENAKDKLFAIASKTRELQGLINKKAGQATEIDEAIEKTEQDYAAAENAHSELGLRAIRVQVKADVARGTHAEQEQTEIATSVMKALEDAQRALADAVQARDDAREKQGLARAIRQEIVEHEREIVELALMRKEYEAVLAEVHRQKGEERAKGLREGIENAHQRRAAALQAQKEAEQDLERLCNSVDRELGEWSDLHQEVAALAWVPTDPSDLEATERIIVSAIDHIRMLLRYGPRAKKMVNPDHQGIARQRLADLIGLDPATIAFLMNGNINREFYRKNVLNQYRETVSVAYNQRIDLLESLLGFDAKRALKFIEAPSWLE